MKNLMGLSLIVSAMFCQTAIASDKSESKYLSILLVEKNEINKNVNFAFDNKFEFKETTLFEYDKKIINGVKEKGNFDYGMSVSFNNDILAINYKELLSVKQIKVNNINPDENLNVPSFRELDLRLDYKKDRKEGCISGVIELKPEMVSFDKDYSINSLFFVLCDKKENELNYKKDFLQKLVNIKNK